MAAARRQGGGISNAGRRYIPGGGGQSGMRNTIRDMTALVARGGRVGAGNRARAQAREMISNARRVARKTGNTQALRTIKSLSRRSGAGTSLFKGDKRSWLPFVKSRVRLRREDGASSSLSNPVRD